MYEKNERIYQLEQEAELVRRESDSEQLHERIHQLQEQLSTQTTAAKESATKLQRFVSSPTRRLYVHD